MQTKIRLLVCVCVCVCVGGGGGLIFFYTLKNTYTVTSGKIKANVLLLSLRSRLCCDYNVLLYLSHAW